MHTRFFLLPLTIIISDVLPLPLDGATLLPWSTGGSSSKQKQKPGTTQSQINLSTSRSNSGIKKKKIRKSVFLWVLILTHKQNNDEQIIKRMIFIKA